MRITRRQDRKRPAEKARCTCMGGADQAREHGKPKATAADHGNPFRGTGCIHSELALTTAPISPRTGGRKAVARLRFQGG